MQEIKDISALDFNKVYTYTDYLTWKFKERVELIKGKIFKMTPAPSTTHQQISMDISVLLYQFLDNKKCRVFSAPFDVRLTKPNLKKTYNVVQPDIVVVCDLSKLDEKGCVGAPDLIVEILSPSTSRKDLNDKYSLYEENSVKEYWIVNLNEEFVLVYDLDEKGKYTGRKPFTKDMSVYSNIIKGFQMDLSELFTK